ncbi:MAG: HAMP domain-containing histidine kinase [Candidatus Omnitrophica bacterium]|nr:HAMP domain-containing histidine kinase [Candidatus Omnitrophota bacterium]MCM8790375.1 HAMP domain-containing histidine kinase [Candidatus Omnitrophota bacterium]
MDKINDISTHLLEFSKATDYKLMEAVDLKDPIKSVLDIAGAEMALNDILVDDATGGAPKVRWNKKYIEKILFNLVQNTIHAIGRKGRIKISAKDAGFYIELTARDTGCGISDENMNHAFEPFFTTKNGHSGVGLGLYIIKQLMTRMEKEF